MKTNKFLKFSGYCVLFFFSVAIPINALKIALMIADFDTIDAKELIVGVAFLLFMIGGLYASWYFLQQMQSSDKRDADKRDGVH